MKRIKFLSLLLLVIAVAILGVVSASALPLRFASGTIVEGYTLDWWTVDGGGTMFSTGGNYSLGGSIGQPDAGTSSGGTYALSGGFWGGGATAHNLFLPLILR
jgi:hypothetical protein